MTSLSDEAERLARNTAERLLNTPVSAGEVELVKARLLAFAKLVLEQHSFRCIAALDKAMVASVVGSNSQTVRQSVDTTTAELLRELTEEGK